MIEGLLAGLDRLVPQGVSTAPRCEQPTGILLHMRLHAFAANGQREHPGLTRTSQDILMESNRIEGIGHQVKGAVMEGLGKAIGDAKLAADGAAERAMGDEQNVAGVGGIH